MQTWHEQNMYLHAHDDENDDDESLFLIAQLDHWWGHFWAM